MAESVCVMYLLQIYPVYLYAWTVLLTFSQTVCTLQTRYFLYRFHIPHY